MPKADAAPRKTHLHNLAKTVASTAPCTIEGLDDHLISYTATTLAADGKNTVLVIARDHSQLTEFAAEMAFLNPKVTVATFPSWDVQPYDRLSADREIQAQRMRTVALLQAGVKPLVVVATVAALSTKIPPLESLKHEALATDLVLRPGNTIDRDKVLDTLVRGGYQRVGTVMEPGEFAVRGSLIDIYPASDDQPYRIDMFDDDISTIRPFDPQSQRSGDKVESLVLHAAGELVMEGEAISTFRQKYRSLFPAGMDDGVYVDVSAGRTHPMMGHYLPLFFTAPLSNLFDVLPVDTTLIAGPTFEAAQAAFAEQVQNGYKARVDVLDMTPDGTPAEPYRPLPPALLYFTADDWAAVQQKGRWLYRGVPTGALPDLALEVTSHLTYTAARVESKKSLGQALAADVRKAGQRGDVVVVTAFSPSSLEHIKKLLEEHDVLGFAEAKTWAEATRRKGIVNGIVAPVAWGFHAPHEGVQPGLWLITEQDIFGEKQNPTYRRKRKSGEEVLTSFNELQPGDYVVHAAHGIGLYQGLETLSAGGTTQDYLVLHYDGGDKLYVPVVALDVLSRYAGAEAGGVRLDKLGGVAWQARKAKVKQKLLEMAGALLKVAARRAIRTRTPYRHPGGLYEEFIAGFPYTPTPEQQAAIDDVHTDMYERTPMDRLVVGDVGFGKTEVALRAAFVAAADGRQVAILAPTTLLVRQHETIFRKRFAGFALNVAAISRLTKPAQVKKIKAGLAKGEVDIVVGTHALLAKDVIFKNLGLMVLDEEQRFGVSHKEKLKQMKSTVDVLTLTATPIPRTMQMSLTGLKTLSTITTPPVDRLAVRSFVMGFDGKVLREAILREIFRGGQVYIVTPTVEGIEKLSQTIQTLVPEAKVRVAHGQMNRDGLEDTMTAFYEGQFNVLVSTTIVESGLDVPNANTIIIHRADRFGLAQLYQLRGRVGRSKTRAYAYFLVPPGGRMGEDAYKRLRILQRLDSLGAGFTLASYDLDLRGPGNLLGAEQSGHIREVGFELYNHMLREAIAELSGESDTESESYTPILNLGLSYRIPEDYVPDLGMRLSLYRRLSAQQSDADVGEFKDELLDRFGPLPIDVAALLDVVNLRNLCRQVNIEKIDVGDKGVLISFYQDRFAAPEKLLHYILQHPGVLSLRPDQKVVLHRRWPDSPSRLKGLTALLTELQKLLPEKPATGTNVKEAAHG